MVPTLLLFTDRLVFDAIWSAACSAAGFTARTVAPDAVADHLTGEVQAVVFDAGSDVFDEDELLACVGLARALGVNVAVCLQERDPDARWASDDVLHEVCAGLVTRNDDDAPRIAAALMRRCDAQRSGRFEYLAVSPRGSELVAILGDGSCALIQRPLDAGDDGSDVSAIVLASDARAAEITLESGAQLRLSAAYQGRQGRSDGATSANALDHVDGVRLGQRLRELRLEAGLTQAELARRTGIHRPNIARVEAGRHTPSLETLARLAAAIGVPTTRVLAG